nr:cytidine and deoxycytidylate deaminase [Hymenolepis microstoma]
MLRLKSIDCIDCLRVVDHLLSEFLGIGDYHIDAAKGLLIFGDHLESEQISEIIRVLSTSGIETFFVPLENGIDKNESLVPVKRSKLEESELAFTTDVSQLCAVIEPANWCSNGHNVPALCASVDPISKMSSCISVLGRLKPLPRELGHLKRAYVKQSGSNCFGRIFLGLASQKFTEENAKDLASQLCKETGILEPTVESCFVPLSQPRSCRQQKALVSLTKDVDGLRSWPFNFHSDQKLESLLSVGGLKDRLNNSAKPYFSVEDLEWHSHWLQRVVNLSKDNSVNGTNASCDPVNPDSVCSCIVIHKPSVKKLDVSSNPAPLVETISKNAKSCIDHAPMRAANEVGRLNLKQSERYLLTDCDVYLSIEPCIMCSMALLHSRVARVFIAKRLSSIGGMLSRWKLPLVKAVNHHFLAFAPSSEPND